MLNNCKKDQVHSICIFIFIKKLVIMIITNTCCFFLLWRLTTKMNKIMLDNDNETCLNVTNVAVTSYSRNLKTAKEAFRNLMFNFDSQLLSKLRRRTIHKCFSPTTLGGNSVGVRSISDCVSSTSRPGVSNYIVALV